VFYANCDFLMAASSLEGFGLSVSGGFVFVEAVLCVRIPAFREVAGMPVTILTCMRSLDLFDS